MHELGIILHMDQHWLWRWYFTNARGMPIAMSPQAYFTYAEARQAVEIMRQTLI